MREKKTEHVVLKCSECGHTNDDWELSQFMRQLGKEYRQDAYVDQCCGCRGYGNTAHVIVGITTVHTKPRTAKQVFSMWDRRKKPVRKGRQKAS
jgi:hypothetical protein